jgi:hypothetical protein
MKFGFFLVMVINSNTMKRLGINVYNQKSLPIVYQSTEHIIPSSLFNKKKDGNYWINMISCDKYTNSIRADYRMGDPITYRDLFLEYQTMNLSKSSNKLITISPAKPYKIVVDATGNVSGVLDRCQRIFYPSLEADMGLISRSIISMLYIYPFLYGNIDRIVANVKLLENYYDLPKSDLEISRQNLIKL